MINGELPTAGLAVNELLISGKTPHRLLSSVAASHLYPSQPSHLYPSQLEHGRTSNDRLSSCQLKVHGNRDGRLEAETENGREIIAWLGCRR